MSTMDQRQIEEALCGEAARLLDRDVSSVDPSSSLGELGLDSVGYVTIAAFSAAHFGVSVKPDVLFEHHSIRETAAYIAALQDRVATPLDAETANVAAPPAPELLASDIAIIGVALRLPGARNLEELATLVESGACALAEVPRGRWAGEDALPVSLRAGVVEGADTFDAAFFNISPREAMAMDPQQRLLMQCAWHAFEDAGYGPAQLSGSATGVFIGASAFDYYELLVRTGAASLSHIGTGVSHAILANRLSQYFNLRAASEAIDTACSSSLVALWRGVETLRRGEANLALVGGVNVFASATPFKAFLDTGMLSPAGCCLPFDAEASGYVRGEGVACLVLKSARAAAADGDRILALIKGGAVRHGGRTQSLTAPSPEAQAQVILAAVEDAKVVPESIGYIETHGTGTSLGDPIEIRGLEKAYALLHRGRGRASSAPHACLGSIKAQIGHLEAAAGMAGVLKALVCLQRRIIPGNAHLKRLNPLIELDNSCFRIPAGGGPWEGEVGGADLSRRPRRAGVSSFGFGGTNAHVILEEAPAQSARRPESEVRLFLLSARCVEALRSLSGQLAERLQDLRFEDSASEQLYLEDLTYTLRRARSGAVQRLAVIAADRNDLVDKLARYTQGERVIPDVLAGEAGREPVVVEGAAGDWRAAASAWVLGATMDWCQVVPRGQARVVALPSYPFAGESFWPEVQAVAAAPEGEAIQPLADEPAITARGSALPALLCFSAKGEAALREYAHRIDQFFDQHPDTDLATFCDTWNACRSHLPTRAALVVSSVAQLRQELRAYSHKGTGAAELILATVGRKEPKIAFAFTGQGAQYVGMGRALYERDSVFRETLDRSEASFERLTGYSLKQVLFEDSALQKRAGCLQPALFVLGHALAQLWRSWGVQPAYVFGHSLGEYAAACATGRLGFDDGLALVAKRGALIEGLDGDGRMLAIDADAKDLKERLRGWESSVVIAADNARGMCTVSGPKTELARLQALLAADGHRVTELSVSHAFHSPQIDPILEEFESFADTIVPGEPPEDIRLLSNVSGREVARETPLRGRYWASQIREPVRFRECVLEAHRSGCNIFLEIGPTGVLSTLIRATLGNQVCSLASLDRNKEDWSTMLRALGEMHCLGANVDLQWDERIAGAWRIAVPKYPFQHPRYRLACGSPLGQFESSSPDAAGDHDASLDRTGLIRAAVAKVCGADVAAIQSEQRLVDDLGFSSIMLVELITALSEKIPPLASIPLSFFFKGGSVGELVQKSGAACETRSLTVPGQAPASSALQAAIARCEIWARASKPRVVMRVPRQWVHQHSERNVLLARQERVSPLIVVGEATQDLAHSFFYDHPQDHVPGMYIIEAVRQLITASAHAYFGVEATRKFVLTDLSTQFERFADVDCAFFMVLDHTDSHFKDGVVTYIDSLTHIVQKGSVISQVRGRGRVMETNEYRNMRGNGSSMPAIAGVESRAAGVGSVTWKG